MDPNTPIPRRAITESLKITGKERTLKAARKNQHLMCRELLAHFSAATLQDNGNWHDIFKKLEKKKKKEKKSPTENILLSKAALLNRRGNVEFQKSKS